MTMVGEPGWLTMEHRVAAATPGPSHDLRSRRLVLRFPRAMSAARSRLNRWWFPRGTEVWRKTAGEILDNLKRYLCRRTLVARFHCGFLRRRGNVAASHSGECRLCLDAR